MLFWIIYIDELSNPSTYHTAIKELHDTIHRTIRYLPSKRGAGYANARVSLSMETIYIKKAAGSRENDRLGYPPVVRPLFIQRSMHS